MKGTWMLAVTCYCEIDRADCTAALSQRCQRGNQIRRGQDEDGIQQYCRETTADSIKLF